MTLKQLEVFLAVADTHSFSKGGAAVSLAQSTASQHIRALEDELSARLLDRSATQVTLTEVGRLFYDHAARICRFCNEATEAVRRFQGLEQATLQVGASTMPAACLIPDLLGGFTRQWPGVRLELYQGDTREVLHLLREDQVELVVVGGMISDERLAFQELGTEQIVLVAPPSMGIAQELSLQQLLELPLVVREPGSGTMQAVNRALQEVGCDHRALRVVAQLGSGEAVRRAVLGGAGAAFVSAFAVARELEDRVLVPITVTGLTVRRGFYLAWRSGRTLSPAAEAFRSEMIASVGWLQKNKADQE